MLIKIKKAQASLEYAALVGVVVGAIIIMSIYMKRSVEGKIRKESDSIGDQYTINGGTYDYVSNLAGIDQDYTIMGTEDTDVDLSGGTGMSWMHHGEYVGEGQQATWTQGYGTRNSQEDITTNQYTN